MNKRTLARYIRGRASERERAAVLLWTEESPENLATYRFLHNIYASTLMESKSGPAVDRKTPAPAFALAFACIAVIAGLFILRPKDQISVQSVCAPVGQQTKVDLSDGTEVWLNSGSSIEFGDIDRQKVRLVSLRGEAFFSWPGIPRGRSSSIHRSSG